MTKKFSESEMKKLVKNALLRSAQYHNDSSSGDELDLAAMIKSGYVKVVYAEDYD